MYSIYFSLFSLTETYLYNSIHMNRKSQRHQTSFLSFRYYCLIKYLLNLSRFCNNVQIMHSLRHRRNAGCNGVLPLTNMFTRYHSYPALRFIPSLQLSLEKAIIFIIHFKTISIRTFRRYTLRSYKFNDCNHSPKYSTIHIYTCKISILAYVYNVELLPHLSFHRCVFSELVLLELILGFIY